MTAYGQFFMAVDRGAAGAGTSLPTLRRSRASTKGRSQSHASATADTLVLVRNMADSHVMAASTPSLPAADWQTWAAPSTHLRNPPGPVTSASTASAPSEQLRARLELRRSNAAARAANGAPRPEAVKAAVPVPAAAPAPNSKPPTRPSAGKTRPRPPIGFPIILGKLDPRIGLACRGTLPPGRGTHGCAIGASEDEHCSSGNGMPPLGVTETSHQRATNTKMARSSSP